jgi:hypothetical protein
MNRNHVYESCQVDVTDLKDAAGGVATAIVLTFVAKNQPDRPGQQWPRLVLRPSDASGLLASLSAAVAVLRASQADQSGPSH